MKYFITFNGQTVGPMTKEQIYAYPVPTLRFALRRTRNGLRSTCSPI